MNGYGKTGSVAIPSTVTSIRISAFYNCTGLTSVTIPDGVTSVDLSFYNCTGLLAITVASSNAAYASVDGVLYNKTLSTLIQCPAGKTGSVAIPSMQKSISDSAFSNCTGLTSVTIPEGVASIASSAFYNCTGLTSVTIPASVTSIGSPAFYNCTGLPAITVASSNAAYTSVDGVLYNKTLSTLIQCPAGKTGSVAIPSTVTSIGSSAFYNCTGLTSVTIPASVTSIGSSAFYNCTGLTSVTIPASVTSIGRSAFYNCTGLPAITVASSNAAYASVDGVLYKRGELTTLIQCPAGKTGSVAIPSTVTSISDSAFYNCTGLTSVTIPASVTSIGSSAFYNCTGLPAITVASSNAAYTSVDGVLYNKTLSTLIQCPAGKTGSVAIRSTVTGIGSSAFYNCTGFTSVTIPEGVASIASSAFYNCTSLTSVTIPVNVTSIGSSAFYNCTGLTSVTIPASVTSIGRSAFHNCTGLPAITVASSNAAYASMDGVLYNKALTTLIQCPAGKTGSVAIPSTVTSISDSAFYNCTDLTSVTIPDGVTSIASSAFYNCTGLTSATIPDGVTSIASSAFYNCTGLTSVTIPDSITIIGGSSFSNCSGLTSVTILADITSIGSYAIGDSAFSGNVSLTSVALPTGLTAIGPAAFRGCRGLGDVLIPSTVRFIGDMAFAGSGLTNVLLPLDVSYIGTGAFRDCLALRTISVPEVLYGSDRYVSRDGVLFRASRSFGGSIGALRLMQYPCSKAGAYALPWSVNVIDEYAFSQCTGLTDVTQSTAPDPSFGPTGIVSIGRGVFYGCTSLTRLPQLSQTISPLMFYGCTGLTRVAFRKAPVSLGDSAFESCTNLLSVRFGTFFLPWWTVGASAFKGCTALTAVYFSGPSGLPQIGAGAFTGADATLYFQASDNPPQRLADRPVEIFQLVTGASGQTWSPVIDTATSRVVKQDLGTAIFATPSSRTGGTIVEAGEIVLQNKDALGTGLLEIQAGAKATFQTGYDTVAVTSLSLANTSRLELGTGKLTVAANGFTESDIRQNLIAGRNGGSWDGSNGITSTFAGGDRAIGYRVADGALEVAYAAPGDVNLDGVFDILDLSEILSAGKFDTGSPANWQQGDTNYDNVFDIVDLADILGTGLFNEGTYLTQASASSAAVETGGVATFDSALVFAALAAEPTAQPTTKRSFCRTRGS